MKTLRSASLALILTATLAAQADPVFEPIFDGTSLSGWDGDQRYWQVEEGAIVGRSAPDQPLNANTFLVWKGGDLADFELKAEFLIASGNSGIQYRSEIVDGQPWVIGGYQADISADHKWTGALYGERDRGILARPGEKAVLGAKPADRAVSARVGDDREILSHLREGWNEYHIIAYGNQCIQMINGVITAEVSENDPGRRPSGVIALQLHQGPPMEVRFRNLRLRRLAEGDKHRVLFLAGRMSHGYNAHEHKAGSLLLARGLNESGLEVVAQVATDGNWPEPWAGYDRPDAVVMYCDGYRHHLALRHQERLQALVDEGVGVVCLHFGVEVFKDELGPQFLDWIGGYFEDGWSVNPVWTPVLEPLPEHPIANGVKPFELRDEWYYHMRFRPGRENITAILSSKPPVETLNRPGSRGTNPTVQAAVEGGEPQVLAWAYERPGGGRGFGFTGGHFHQNWRQDDFRTLVLNAVYWTAGGTVPEGGVVSRTPSELDMKLNQDYPEPGDQ